MTTLNVLVDGKVMGTVNYDPQWHDMVRGTLWVNYHDNMLSGYAHSVEGHLENGDDFYVSIRYKNTLYLEELLSKTYKGFVFERGYIGSGIRFVEDRYAKGTCEVKFAVAA